MGCTSKRQERSMSRKNKSKPYSGLPRCLSDRPTGAHLSLLTTLEGRHSHPSHFVDEQTEAQRVKSRAQGHTAKKLESQESNLRSPHGPGQDQRG